MSKTKKRKSTVKHKKADTSKMIPIIAIIEVIVLIVASSYAWYYLNLNKTLSSGIITVNADSGLEIDFKDATDKTTYIDIFDYVNKDTFSFEPASSVDGRNIYFPTTGTFDNTDTSKMVFREGTVNDINSKYLNIDFELTNTTSKRMDVYLSSRSSFTIRDGDNKVNGKALRLAFYNNDGSYGRVTSKLLNSSDSTEATEAGETPGEAETVADSNYDTTESFTVYFLNNQNWDSVNVYVWNHADDDSYAVFWPGAEAKQVSGNLYSYTFSNDFTLGEGDVKEYFYDRIVFSNNGGAQTVDLDNLAASNGKLYTPTTTTDSKFNCSVTAVDLSTVYFLAPYAWTSPACRTSETAFDAAISSGNPMTKVTNGIYSYTFPSTDKHMMLVDNDDSGRRTLVDTVLKDESEEIDHNGDLFYFPKGAESGKLYSVNNRTSEIFFYNTRGWSQPYAHVTAFPDSDGYGYSIPMEPLTGDLYYCRLSTAFLSNRVADSTATFEQVSPTAATVNVSTLASNCTVYFEGTLDGNTESSQIVACYGDHVYRLLDTVSDSKYLLYDEDYSKEVNVTNSSYAVISPGVSAGFQRSANPVNKINAATGAAESIIPAFASSFDDYILGSNNPVFKIDPLETVNMSMIVWLEGTDLHCTGENYAGKDINLYLEFSTVLAGDLIEDTFTYRFIDETEQHWTSDTATNAITGSEVSPVMQLYDATLDRGYLMKAKDPVMYAGVEKVKTWECVAPQNLVSDNKEPHVLEFRRVNPYDETMVWNRWEAGVGCDYYADSCKNRIVSFTAFADGSPDYEMYKDSISGLPTLSCGGLWGSFGDDIELLTVYDGRKSRLSGTDTLNFGYTYTYPKSRKQVQIEYKSSGCRNIGYDKAHKYSEYNTFSNFYSFVVPTTIYDNASQSYFRIYKGAKDKTALNSDLNNALEVGTTWFAGTVDGKFFEFNEEGTNSPDKNNHSEKNTGEQGYHSYWGSDVIYIQGESTLSVSYSSVSGNCFMQIKFYDSGNESKKIYSYLYDDYKYKGSYGYGFVAVVPNNQTYDSYCVQRVRNQNHIDITREADIVSSISGTTYSTSGGKTMVLNTIKSQTADDSSTVDGRILHLKYDIRKIYFQAKDFSHEQWHKPDLYDFSAPPQVIATGTDTEQYQDGKHVYEYEVRSSYTSAQFYWSSPTKYSLSISPADGYCYYPDSDNGSNIKMGGYINGLSDLGLHGNSDDAASWNTEIGYGFFGLELYTDNKDSGWPEYKEVIGRE